MPCAVIGRDNILLSALESIEPKAN
jgi:hypothetical protein